MRPLAERQQKVLLILLAHEGQDDAVKAAYGMTPNDIGAELSLPAVEGGGSGSGRGSGHRVFGPAQRVISSLNGLRSRGLVDLGPRRDGRSGTAYSLTVDGRVEALKLSEPASA